MLPPLTRHTIHVLVAAGHTHVDVARFAGVDERTVRRVAREAPVTPLEAVVQPHRVGRPSTAEPYRQLVTDVLGDSPILLSVEILRRARLAGYDGGKTALYDLIASVRPRDVQVEMRFEGLPGEFSQHDFGQIEIHFRDGRTQRVHFFASRLKWSRWIEVTVVPNETAETLIRTLADHFVAFGGVPLTVRIGLQRTHDVTAGALVQNLVGLLVALCLLPLFALIFLEGKTRPPRPAHVTRRHLVAQYAMWPAMAVITFFWASLPALHAQWRLASGRGLVYLVAEKGRRAVPATMVLQSAVEGLPNPPMSIGQDHS